MCLTSYCAKCQQPGPRVREKGKVRVPGERFTYILCRSLTLFFFFLHPRKCARAIAKILAAMTSAIDWLAQVSDRNEAKWNRKWSHFSLFQRRGVFTRLIIHLGLKHRRWRLRKEKNYKMTSAASNDWRTAISSPLSTDKRSHQRLNLSLWPKKPHENFPSP